MNTNDFAEAQRLLRMANETLWTNEQVKAYWDSRDGTNYGAGMQQWLPEYDETHALLLDVVAAHLPPNSRVLDLGAGNGRVSKLILERFPTRWASVPRRSATTCGTFTKSCTSIPAPRRC